jgi:hypothetical protein
MALKKYQPLLEISLISIMVYALHKLFFFLNENDKFKNFHFPIEVIYLFFFCCSIIILSILIKVKEKNIDNVGSVFLLITCVKMAISYALLYPIIHSGNQDVKTEKINFFIIFFLFLTIETIVTIRLLNNNQQITKKT